MTTRPGDPRTDAPVTVPGSFADLTADWFTAALRRGPTGAATATADGQGQVAGATVAADGQGRVAGAGIEVEVEVETVSIEPLGESVGLLGDLARVHLRYRESSAGPATVIVKLPASDPGGYQVGSMLRAWAREVAFYQEVAPVSPGARVPRCYHAGADPAAERWVVVLEDCPAVPVDPAIGATTAQAEAAVDALAQFHCTWWESGGHITWMPGFDTTGVGGLQGAWLDALPLFRRRYGHVTPAPTGEWVERFAAILPDWSDRTARTPLTVVHADYRLDNLLFAPSSTSGDDDGPVEVTMIDWQTALRGPGAMDLTSFCATSLTIHDRRATEADLIDRYLDGLRSGGVHLDLERFTVSYDENLLWWMGQFASNLARLEPDDADTQHALDTMIERTFTAALDRDVGRLLD